MTDQPPPFPDLMTRTEVARILRVHPATVTRWADAGHLRALRTPGGNRRFYAADVQAILRTEGPP